MSARDRVVVFGAGGHAKVVVATLRACGHEVSVVVDDDPGKVGLSILGVPVIAADDARCPNGGTAVVAIGANRARCDLVERSASRDWLTVVHPAATVHSSARLGRGSVVFAGAVVQPEATIGEHAILNTGSTVDHDCALSDFVHLGPGSHLAGSVTLGRGALVGAAAAITPGRTVGAWATIGAGAAVITDLPDHSTAVGVPARVLSEADG